MLSLSMAGLGLIAAMATAIQTAQTPPTFDDAIEIIKKYEGNHSKMHWPFVGYGHKVMPGEKFKRGVKLTEAEADALLREDYSKLCAKYRDFGADSLLLAALAYNCGPGTVGKSSVLKKLKEGNRDIEAAYISHSRYRGKQLSQLKRRRQEELAVLYVKETATVEPDLHHEGEGYEETQAGIISLELPEEMPDSSRTSRGI